MLCTKKIPLKEQGFEGDKIVIGKNCWLCKGCIILPGVTIGDGVVVAANAVVTKNVPPYTVVGGVPAKLIKKYDKNGIINNYEFS